MAETNALTIADLIAKLREMPQDAVVYRVGDERGGGPTLISASSIERMLKEGRPGAEKPAERETRLVLE